MADLTYRLMRPDDGPAVRRLWAEETHWGALDAGGWERWFRHAPGGPAVVALAEDDAGAVVGHLAFLPVGLWVDGERITAWRSVALILTRPHRRPMVRPLRHPALRLYATGAAALRARGAEVVFGMPDLRMLQVVRRVPMWDAASFPLWSRPVGEGAAPPTDPGVTHVPLDDVDASEVDALDSAAGSRAGCRVAKTTAVLRWKASDGRHSGLGARRDGLLEAVVTTRIKRAGKGARRQLDVCDLLGRDDAGRATALAAAVRHAEEVAADLPADDPLTKVTLLVTPTLERAAADLGFTPDDYRFPLAVHRLGPARPEAQLDPRRWELACDD